MLLGPALVILPKNIKATYHYVDVMVEKFRFLEHTADDKFEAFGDSKEELFTNCSLAMTAVMTSDVVTKKISHTIEIKANRIESLLFDFLNELLFVLESEKLILADIKEIKIDDNKLIATIIGDNVNNYDIEAGIKAVTYNDMIVVEKNNKWRAIVVVDL